MNMRYRSVLFLSYSSGFQVWDCNNLVSVSEVLNLSAPWGYVSFAAALPPLDTDDAQLSSLWPLIGVIIQGQSMILIYSLRTHEVVKQLPFHNVSSFASSKLFTVISTANPPTLFTFFLRHH
ncbi:hypothetical protein L210DRAFT_730743 [Boletus edulis BED1]|uniref:Uncharacterized protein n=1 Tax=Boletus edulis BED1 TaxID=1328754 RepID=A0AAD4G5E8_BOLED|nr:hypothetical protein L210DRAFT_730743 [Boletus edulis BED1]